MYWYFTYAWNLKDETYWEYADGVFYGSFLDLVLMTKCRPEIWVLTFAKEIDEDEYVHIVGHIS